MANELQAAQMAIGIAPLIAMRTRWRRQQSNAFIVSDQLNRAITQGSELANRVILLHRLATYL